MQAVFAMAPRRYGREVPVGDPWTEEDRPPRRPGWGCLAAAIVTGIGVIVAAVLAVRLLAAALTVSPVG